MLTQFYGGVELSQIFTYRLLFFYRRIFFVEQILEENLPRGNGVTVA
jgi:hypothetical protein